MSNELYLIHDKCLESKISSLIQKYDLQLCYNTKSEQVLKSENMLLLIKKKYAFLRFMGDDKYLKSEIWMHLGA